MLSSRSMQRLAAAPTPRKHTRKKVPSAIAIATATAPSCCPEAPRADQEIETDLLRHIMSAGELGGWVGPEAAPRPLDLWDIDVEVEVEVEAAPLLAPVAVEHGCAGDSC